MKKYLPLLLGALLFTSNAAAYDNPAAGFSVKDNKPAISVEGRHFYGYSDLQAGKLDSFKLQTPATFHMINYYSTTDVRELLKLAKPFTNQDFEDCYNNISLLQRAELDPEIVPSPLLKLFFRNEEQLQGDIALAPIMEKMGLNSFKQQRLLPTITVGEYNKQKCIRLSYLFQQGDDLFSLTSDMVAANNNLYVLSSVYVNNGYFAAKPDLTKQKAIASDLDKELYTSIKKNLQIKKLTSKDIQAYTAKAIDKSHTSFLKSFTTAPNARIRHLITYPDRIDGNELIVPENGLLMRLKGMDKDMSGDLYLTTSLDSFTASDKDKDTAYTKQKEILLKRVERHSKNTDPDETNKALQTATNELIKLKLDNNLNKLDSLIITGSISFKKESPFKTITEEPKEAKQLTLALLETGLAALSQALDKPELKELISIEKLEYDAVDSKAGINVQVNAKLLLLAKHDYAYQAKALCTAKDVAFKQILIKEGKKLTLSLK